MVTGFSVRLPRLPVLTVNHISIAILLASTIMTNFVVVACCYSNIKSMLMIYVNHIVDMVYDSIRLLSLYMAGEI